jgi:hypothetical protein
MAFIKDRRSRQPVSVTGRDVYLVLQALAYTIRTIEALPEDRQEFSNKEQMKILLDVWSRGRAEDFLTSAQRHIDGGRVMVTGWSERWRTTSPNKEQRT